MSPIDQAIAKFCTAANQKGDFASPARKDHALHGEMAAAVRILQGYGQEGVAAFRTLLEHSSPCVRTWVAAELLSQGDQAAVAVLEEIAQGEGMIAFEARTTLQEQAAGRLQSPFRGAV